MHEKTHSGTNPHFCATCDIYFPRLSKLAKHFRTKSHLQKQGDYYDNDTVLYCNDSVISEPPCKKMKEEEGEENTIEDTNGEEGSSSSDNKLDCKHCNKNFSNISEQQLHLAACVSTRPRKGSNLPKDYLKRRAKVMEFLCPLCDNKFKEYAGLNEHISKDHEVNEETQFSCKSCVKTYASKEKWVSHLNDTDHLSKLCTIFQATCCDKTFKTHKACYNHERVHTRQSPYFCEKCDRYFLKKHHLTVHLEGCQNSERPYACPYCPRCYKTSNQLQHHLEGGHSFKCVTCEKNFSCKPYLKTHLEESPECIKNICSRCNNLEFPTAAELAYHKNELHNTKGRKTFSCTDCLETYNEAYKLKQHMEWHATGKYPYQCSVDGCSVVCFKRSKLDSHIKRVHLKISEFACSACGEEFKAKKHLDEHNVKVHGQESFNCPICNKLFLSLKSMENHKISHSKVATHVDYRQDDSVLDLRSLTHLSMALDGSSSSRGNSSLKEYADEGTERPTQIEFKIPTIVSRDNMIESSDDADPGDVGDSETVETEFEGEQEYAQVELVQNDEEEEEEEKIIVIGNHENGLTMSQDREGNQMSNQYVTIKIASSGISSNNSSVTPETMQQLKSTLSDLLSATMAGGSQTSDNAEIRIQGEPKPNEDGVVEIVLMPAPEKMEIDSPTTSHGDISSDKEE